jgi:hypothetical protein
VAALLASCGGSGSSTPSATPGVFAVSVVKLIVGNHYTRAGRMHSADQKVAP